MRFISKAILTLSLISLSCSGAYAWNLSDLLGKAQESMGNTSVDGVLGLVDGLFSNSDFDVAQLEGTWEVTGSAVGMNSDQALANIGGKAATLAIEKKLDPYFQSYGLTGSQITFDKEGNFTLKLKKMSISGTVTKTGKSDFQTQFNVFGSTKLSSMGTYFEKGVTGSTLSVMWDASKAITLMQGIASFVKVKSASTIASLLSQYDDLYVGFKLSKVK